MLRTGLRVVHAGASPPTAAMVMPSVAGRIGSAIALRDPGLDLLGPTRMRPPAPSVASAVPSGPPSARTVLRDPQAVLEHGQASLDIVTRLRERGTAVGLHHPPDGEIRRLANRVTALKDGQVGAAWDEVPPTPPIITAMVGRELGRGHQLGERARGGAAADRDAGDDDHGRRPRARLVGGAPRGYLTNSFRSFGQFTRWDVPVIGLLPAALLVLLAVGAALWWLMHRTNYGRLLHAVGNNPEAACLAGVPVARVRVLAFVISSASAVVAGVLLGGFSGVSLDVGSGYELQAITAAVLGSTQLLGGRGSVGPTVGTALTLKAIFTLLNFLGLPQPVREVVQGLILLLAVAAAMRRRATG